MVKVFAVFLFSLFTGFITAQETLAEKTLALLDKKCNLCHAEEKPDVIFTKENMNDYARKINRQVFVFKLMPKGKEIVLDKEERLLLKEWIKDIKRH